MHNLKANFNKFLAIAKSFFRDEINTEGNFQFYPNKPEMSDLQIITLSCLAVSLSLDSENWLFGKLRSGYPGLFPDLVHRTTYNRSHLNDLLADNNNKPPDTLITAFAGKGIKVSK